VKERPSSNSRLPSATTFRIRSYTSFPGPDSTAIFKSALQGEFGGYFTLNPAHPLTLGDRISFEVDVEKNRRWQAYVADALVAIAAAGF
jgi:hypothetical protein